MENTVNVKAAFGKNTGISSAYFEDDQVWVYDSVAGHYTTCHSLTNTQISRVKRLANRSKTATYCVMVHNSGGPISGATYHTQSRPASDVVMSRHSRMDLAKKSLRSLERDNPGRKYWIE